MGERPRGRFQFAVQSDLNVGCVANCLDCPFSRIRSVSLTRPNIGLVRQTSAKLPKKEGGPHLHCRARNERLSGPSEERRDETFQFAYSMRAISLPHATAAVGFGGPGRAVLMAQPRNARSLADSSGNQTCSSATAPNTPGNATPTTSSAFSASGTAGGITRLGLRLAPLFELNRRSEWGHCF